LSPFADLSYTKKQKNEVEMVAFIFRLIMTTIAVVISAYYIPGLEIKDLTDAIIFGIILGFINAFIRPIISFLTLPITMLTLGLFALVINAFTFWLASEISYGVHILTIAGAFWGGGIVWIVSIFANIFVKSNKLI